MLNLSYALITFSLLTFLWSPGFKMMPQIPAINVLLLCSAYIFCLFPSKEKTKLFNLKVYKNISVISILLILNATLLLLVNNHFFIWSNRIVLFIYSLMIAMVISISIRNYRQINIYLNILIIGLFISSLVGIGQKLIGEPFINIWLSLGNNRSSYMLSVLSGRIAGLADYAVPLASQLASVIPIVTARIFYTKDKLLKINYIIILISLFVAIVFTEVRSALIGALIGVTFIFANKHNLSRKNKKNSTNIIKYIFAFLLVAIVYFIIGNNYETTRFTDFNDPSSQVRLPMQLTAINYALHHPIGTGIYENSTSYIPKFLHNNSVVFNSILSNTSHNQFTNILVYYGFLGLILLVMFYFYIFKSLINLLDNCKDEFYSYRWVIFGLIGSFISYIINSIFHNGGPFIGDVTNWFIIGLSIAVSKLISKPNNNIGKFQ